jgi:hypothetical protein
MSGKSDHDQFAAPGIDMQLKLLNIDLGIVEAADHQAWKGKPIHRLAAESDHTGVHRKRRLERAWRDKQRAADMLGLLASRIASDQ